MWGDEGREVGLQVRRGLGEEMKERFHLGNISRC